MSEKPKQIEVHYLKTPNYRSYHVDGVLGGITPAGTLYIELFLQRWPTPKSILHEVNDDGTLGKELGRDSKTGLIREVEAGLTMDLAAAEVIHGWLGEKIKLLKELKSGNTK
jgi:hypothetical protein